MSWCKIGRWTDEGAGEMTEQNDELRECWGDGVRVDFYGTTFPRVPPLASYIQGITTQDVTR